MEFTIEQHYDITWLVAFAAVGLWMLGASLARKFWISRQEKRSKSKLAHLTRYSFMRAQ